MSGSPKVSWSDPLAEFVSGFAAELDDLGYSSRGAEAQLRLMRQLSIWLAGQGFAAADLTVEVVERYVAARRSRHSNMRSVRALAPLLGFLRRVGAVPMPLDAAPVGPAGVLTARFGEYLHTQRGLAPATVLSYTSQAAMFLVWRIDQRGAAWESLTAKEIAEFVTVRATGQRPRSLQVGINALRALLRWMSAEGQVPAGLAESIGPVAAPAMTSVPKALAGNQIADLFAGLPPDGPVRLRNEAMLLLLWRMGLRAGEVAVLRLDDIDWRNGVILVRGKGDRHEQMPLPADVGESLAAYVKHGRPTRGGNRHVFLGLDAPHRPIGTACVSSVVARAAAGAGIDGPVHAHRLRHTAACRVLTGGGGLVEAGQLLRHGSTAATAIYAKADITTLAALARPWPNAGAR
jgi:site-specific recombinase XerD